MSGDRWLEIAKKRHEQAHRKLVAAENLRAYGYFPEQKTELLLEAILFEQRATKALLNYLIKISTSKRNQGGPV